MCGRFHEYLVTSQARSTLPRPNEIFTSLGPLDLPCVEQGNERLTRLGRRYKQSDILSSCCWLFWW